MTLYKVSYCLFHSLQKVEYDEECDTKLEEQCETTQVIISIAKTAQVIYRPLSLLSKPPI